MQNVMKDLETFGTLPGCAIRSIGAAFFDPFSDRVGEKFYVNVEQQSCLDIGLKMDQRTVDWWNEPKNRKAQDSLMKDQIPIKDALVQFTQWWNKNRGVFLWSQGGNFDEPILRTAFDAAGMKEPWKFYDCRCTRTAYSMAEFNPFTVKRAGTYHNALDDSLHQIVCVQRAYAKLNGKMV